MPFDLEYIVDSFSVRIYGRNSPRLVSFVDGFVCFQVSTCYPCPVCDHRVETLKRKLQCGAYSHFGLLGNEVLHNLHGNRTYNIVKGDQVVFFVFPYVASNAPQDFCGLFGWHAFDECRGRAL